MNLQKSKNPKPESIITDLDATKYNRLPPSFSLKHKKPSKFEDTSAFCGSKSSLNSRIIHLADLGRCDLYSEKKQSEDPNELEKLKEPIFLLGQDKTSSELKKTLSKSKQSMLKLPKLVELAVPPKLEAIKSSSAMLPNSINVNSIIEKLQEVNNLEYLRYSQRLLRSTPSFICDCFWFVFLDRFGKNQKFGYDAVELKSTKIKLKDKISTKFLDLILKSEINGSFRAAGHKCFFNQLYKLLALITYAIFCYAWPDSWRRFVSDDFRQYLIDRFSLWIEGIKHVPGEGED